MTELERRPIDDLLTDAAGTLRAAQASDTAVVLQAAWRGFCVAGAAGELLSHCADSQTYPALWTNAQPVLCAAIVALGTAPSLPVGLVIEINPAGGPHERVDDEAAERIRGGILTLAGVLNTVLPPAADNATGQDAQACRTATTLSSELYDCYTGRLRSFLNPYRDNFGPGSFVVRGQGRRPAGPRNKRRR